MNNTRKVPGRPGKGVGPKVENPGKMLKTLMEATFPYPALS